MWKRPCSEGAKGNRKPGVSRVHPSPGRPAARAQRRQRRVEGGYQRNQRKISMILLVCGKEKERERDLKVIPSSSFYTCHGRPED